MLKVRNNLNQQLRVFDGASWSEFGPLEWKTWEGEITSPQMKNLVEKKVLRVMQVKAPKVLTVKAAPKKIFKKGGK